MIYIKNVDQYDGPVAVLTLLSELAKFEKMEANFNPDLQRLRWQLHSHENPKLYAALAYDGPNSVGVVVYYIGSYSSFRSTWSVYLEDVFIRESHRGQGLLRKLLQPVAVLACDRSINEIAFSVLDWNEHAIAAYRKLGAVETGSRIDSNGIRWLTMAFQDRTVQALAQ